MANTIMKIAMISVKVWLMLRCGNCPAETSPDYVTQLEEEVSRSSSMENISNIARWTPPWRRWRRWTWITTSGWRSSSSRCWGRATTSWSWSGGSSTPSQAQSQVSPPLSLVQIHRDTVFWLVEPYYAGTKVSAITIHHKSWEWEKAALIDCC